MTGDWTWIALGTVNFALALRGVHMTARPAHYLGSGIVPARDPRTVRFFGGPNVFFGAAVAILTLVKVAQ